jgi:hypothetical protein
MWAAYNASHMAHTRIDAVDNLDPKLGWVRRCATCKAPKIHDDFHKSSRDHRGIQRVCKGCASKRPRRHHPKTTPEQYKVRYAKERDQTIEYSRGHYRTVRGRFLTLISAARGRARKKKWEHDLDIEWALALWVKQKGRCLITNVPLEIDTPLRTQEKYLNPFAPSLDRIECSKGYTKDNTRIVCVAANLAMNRFGAEVLRTMLQSYSDMKRG